MSEEEFEVDDDFLAVGRTFAEYRRMFDLDPGGLGDSVVLDCGGGVGSFTATASELGADARAVDPLYGPPVDALAETCRDAIADLEAQLREQRAAYVWDFYGDVETRVRYLRAAAERFLTDYAHRPERYVAGALPDLPLESNAVDLALSANFLFLYDDRLDRAFHVAALRELARVAREARVFPLASLDRTRSGYVGAVSTVLRDEGIGVEIRPVPYEFQPGATEMLVLSTEDGTGDAA